VLAEIASLEIPVDAAKKGVPVNVIFKLERIE
jgi:hypothetical protein